MKTESLGIFKKIFDISEEYPFMSGDKLEVFLHSYGVAVLAGYIAMTKGECVNLAFIAGLMHDYYTLKTNDTEDHASKSSIMAKEFLSQNSLLGESEINKITFAIQNHSNKETVGSTFEEILKDADVFQRYIFGQYEYLSTAGRKRIDWMLKRYEI